MALSSSPFYVPLSVCVYVFMCFCVHVTMCVCVYMCVCSHGNLDDDIKQLTSKFHDNLTGIPYPLQKLTHHFFCVCVSMYAFVYVCLCVFLCVCMCV